MSWRNLFLGFLVTVLLLVLVFVVMQPWLWKWHFGEDFPVAIQGLEWILTAIIAILSIGVALYGILTYQVLRQTLATQFEQTIANQGNARLARAFGNLGYSFWRNWRHHEDDRPMLYSAINAETCALDLISKIEERDYPGFLLETRYQIMSNLSAYVAYLGMKFGAGDVDSKLMEQARRMGAKALEKATEFGNKADWKANYAGFLNIYGTPKEEAQAHEIMQELKQRKDVDDASYNEYLELFPSAPSNLLRHRQTA